jgi:hypothetical protein
VLSGLRCQILQPVTSSGRTKRISPRSRTVRHAAEGIGKQGSWEREPRDLRDPHLREANWAHGGRDNIGVGMMAFTPERQCESPHKKMGFMALQLTLSLKPSGAVRHGRSILTSFEFRGAGSIYVLASVSQLTRRQPGRST